MLDFLFMFWKGRGGRGFAYVSVCFNFLRVWLNFLVLIFIYSVSWS